MKLFEIRYSSGGKPALKIVEGVDQGAAVKEFRKEMRATKRKTHIITVREYY